MAISPNTPPGTQSNPSNDNDTSVVSLIRQLAHEVPALMTKEIALVKAELRESIQATRQGVMSIGLGAIVMLGGLVMVLLAAVYALSQVLAPWLAALLVGVAALVIGFFMVQAGKKRLEPTNLVPERTASTLHKDKEALQRKVS
ncbi:phage holin family protein [Pseudomonas sp. CDFA 602]|uniref:phage holin family protein n=1 Tax=Pseudomonas californiensis TaxID=2829823 RepID=UPI001E394AB0|nr:phage holin family protein [Pseudomonas californiensis]MCD5992831.1 phage holin family protein [Pseudomonas californiensis]MCD5998711.1 phage holin family protein [Pseudomonas californiensis]